MDNALKAVLRQRETSCQIALFLDGLDEFSGEYIDPLLEMIDQFRALPDGQIVKLKVCFASRRLSHFQKLEDYPGLVLEDITIADISAYVNEKLSSMGFSRTQRQPSVDEITTRANGCFLWVILVVHELERGYLIADRLSDLKRRLDEVPVALEDIYVRIMGTILQIYARQVYMMLQVALCALRPLSLEAFSSCISDVPDTPKDHERFEAQQKMLTRRITDKCKGMLKVTSMPFWDEETDYPESNVLQGGSYLPAVVAARPGQGRSVLAVQFFHPSFLDFYRHNQDDLFGSVSPSDRQSGNLLLLQAGVKSEQPWAHELARDIFTYAHRIEKGTPREAEDAAKALGSLSYIGGPLQGSYRLMWSLPQAQIPGWLEFLGSLDDRVDLRLLCLAVAANLTSYVRTRLSQDKMVEILLPLAIFGPKIVSENTNRTEMVEVLLRYGIPINQYPLSSLFDCFIRGRASSTVGFEDLPTSSTLALILGDTENQWYMEEADRSELITLLIEHGAPVDDMIYRFRKGMREFREGLPALHHCVVQESPELVRVFLSHSQSRIDWPVSLGLYAVMRQDTLIADALRSQHQRFTLTRAGRGADFVLGEKTRGDCKELLIAASLSFTAYSPGWAVPNPKESVLGKILARLVWS